MLGQPTTALGQSLWMRQHLINPGQISLAQEGMTNGQHQSATNTQVAMGPQRIQGGRHPTLNRILNRHYSRIAHPACQLLNNSAQANTGNVMNIAHRFELHQSAGGLLSIGPCWAEVSETCWHGKPGRMDSIGSCRVK